MITKNKVLGHVPVALAPFVAFLLLCCSSAATISPSPTDVPPLVNPCMLQKKQTIVILGSSIAAAVGASHYDSSWAGRLTTYCRKTMNFKDPVINLARGGYVTAQILPNYTKNPQIDPKVNIDAALKFNPTCIIISMTTNDVAMGVPYNEIMSNLETTIYYALSKGIRYVLVTTPFPRSINDNFVPRYLAYRDGVLQTYGAKAINFFDPVADGDNLPRKDLLSGDHVHPNDKGHEILFRSLLVGMSKQDCN